MTKKTTQAAGTSPFAHLLGGAAALAGRALGRQAEQDAPDTIEADDDPEIETPDEPEQPDAPETSANPDTPDEPEDPETPDEEVAEPTAPKEAKAFRDGRAAERARCAAIFASPAAAGRPDLAATLAFSTSQTSAEAVAVLTAASAGAPPPRARLDDRMGNRTDPKPGAGGATTTAKGDSSFADQMAAAQKVAGR